MSYRPGDPTVELEAEIEFTSSKAWLIRPTMTVRKQVWLPKSQVVEFSEPDESNNRVFTVTKWWHEKARLDEDLGPND